MGMFVSSTEDLPCLSEAISTSSFPTAFCWSQLHSATPLQLEVRKSRPLDSDYFKLDSAGCPEIRPGFPALKTGIQGSKKQCKMTAVMICNIQTEANSGSSCSIRLCTVAAHDFTVTSGRELRSPRTKKTPPNPSAVSQRSFIPCLQYGS